MARIYIARSTGIGSFERHVVLKMILPERAHDETSVQMFLDEARLAASLNHQNVAQVFEVGKEAGIHFLAMEYVHGQDLRALLAKAGSAGTRVPLELALAIVTGAAAGLDHAHERRTSDGTPMGIVHRDVSPSNIMIGYDGSVKLLDFGIAKATSRSVETQSGIIKGKFAYMAPEQCRGRDVDRRSDVFSLGIILYEVTTQHRCFRADSDFDTMHRIVTGDIVRPTRLVQGYPQALEAIVLKALSVDAAQRYQSAGLLLEAIESYAATSRMPLSTVALGRFMRDMFGEVQEPWLAAGRISQPLAAREQTISNTNGAGDEPRLRPSSPMPLPPPPRPASSQAFQRPSSPSASSPAAQRPPSASSPAVPRPSTPSTPPPAFQRSSSASSPSAQALPPQHEEAPLHLPPDLALDLPGRSAQPGRDLSGRDLPGRDAAAEPAPARSYPSAPGYASPQLPPMPPQLPSSPQAIAPATLGMPLAPQLFIDHSKSESGVAHGALPLGTQPIATTRRGYANAPAISPSELYQRFEPQELEGNVSLQPNNRLLYIGLGVVLVGIIVLLAISIMDDSDDAPAPAPPAAAPSTSRGEPGAERGPQVAAAAPVTPVRSSLKPDAVKPEAFRSEAQQAGAPASGRHPVIHLRLVSTPAGAEVLLGGKPLGTTPLVTEIEPRRGTEVLTIHRTRYQDVTAIIDLGRDYEQAVTLVPIAEPASPRAAPDHDARSTARDKAPGRDARHAAPAAPSAAKEPDCQPPDKINPFEKACHGHVCQPCPAAAP
jgi:serine/threonine protein kinase